MADQQNLLLEQYRILHEASQAAHRYAWQMTSIFVPVIGAGVVFALKEPPAGPGPQTVLLAALIVIIWFWKGVLVFLDHCNDVRRDRLIALEEELSRTGGVTFSYYRAMSENPAAYYKKFSFLTRTLALLLTTALLIVMFAPWGS